MSPARVLLCVLALTACKKESSTKADPKTKVGGVALTVDGKAVDTIDPGSASTYPPLAALLPSGKQNMDSWASIALTTADGATQTIDDPPAKQPGQVAGLFPSGAGVGFGFFLPADLAKKGEPKWQVKGVVAIAVTTKGASGASAGGQGGGDGAGGGAENSGDRPTPTADLKITIDSAAGEVVFTGDKLVGLPVAHAPSGDTDTPGWTLDQVLKAAGVATPKGQVVVDGGEGANLILDPSDWDPAKAVLFIKLNRSGALRFRVFRKNGDAWEIGGELRGLDKVEIK